MSEDNKINAAGNQSQMQRPPNSIKAIPLDGQNNGMPFYQQVYSDSRVQMLANQLELVTMERNCLRADLSKYKAECRVANTTYEIRGDKEKMPGVTLYHINLKDVGFMHVCEGIKFYQGMLRSMLNAHISKEFLNSMTVYLAEKYLAVSREEAMSKINRAGDAADSVTVGIRTVRELIQSFDDEVGKFTPLCNPEYYIAKIRQFASSLNVKDYEIFYVEFFGEIYTDARVYHELKGNPEFSSALSQFQLDLLFAIDLFCDYPQILAGDAGHLIDFMIAVQKGADVAAAIKVFRDGITRSGSGDSLGKKSPASLDDRSCDVLEFCLENGNGPDGVSAKAMMAHIKEASKSHFSKAILKPLRDLGYLRFSCLDSHSSHQGYCITPAGVTALRKARPGRTYPEPIRTDSDTVPAVPNGKTE